MKAVALGVEKWRYLEDIPLVFKLREPGDLLNTECRRGRTQDEPRILACVVEKYY